MLDCTPATHTLNCCSEIALFQLCASQSRHCCKQVWTTMLIWVGVEMNHSNYWS